jgi:hypothetical protein
MFVKVQFDFCEGGCFCKVLEKDSIGIVDYSVSGECAGGRGNGVKDRGRQGGEDRERRREWKKRAEKIVGGRKESRTR